MLSGETVVHLGIEWGKIETDLRAVGPEDMYWIQPAQHGVQPQVGVNMAMH
jgi:hypothetical protein